MLDFALSIAKSMSGSETKVCQNCKTSFEIDASDFNFYEKLKVPPPTWCPPCRRQRRFVWRNERTLYKRNCNSCNKSILAIYPSEAPFPVYCYECWTSDRWDPLSFGAEYNFSKPFFAQLRALIEKVPRLAMWQQQCFNSEYTQQSYSNKNTYLSFALRDCEDTAYAARAVALRNCFDALYTHYSEGLYESVDVQKSYRGRFLQEAEACVESGFLMDSRNCQNCLGGVNLRSASHVLFGERLTKEEFAMRTVNIDLGSRATQERLLREFEEIKKKSIFRFAKLTNCVNSLGDHLGNAKNAHWVFDGFELENARYSSWVFTSKEISDCYGMGSSQFVYEGIGNEEVQNVFFCNIVDGSHHVQYSDICSASANLFGCIGIRTREYCILNKQYSKEEYDKLMPKIIDHLNIMPYVDSKGRVYKYGEFFPPELSPFAYNETVAQENYPLTREQAETQGYLWREPEERNYSITKTTSQIPNSIKEVPDSFVKEVIGCAHVGKCAHQCSTAFRIVTQELQFYRQMNIPLPTLCPNCRHYERLERRNPVYLWHRKCICAGSTSTSAVSSVPNGPPQAGSNYVYKNTVKHFHGSNHCPNEFETSYAPERPEIVYCEQCYNAEIV